LEGSGQIHANGGTNITESSGAGGGGGRVAVYFDDMSAFTGAIQARGGLARPDLAPLNRGGAGTVYLKNNGASLGELIVDNGGLESVGWSTVLPPEGLIRLLSLDLIGNARVSTTNLVRVATGDAAQFLNLISNNLLQVRGLFVGDYWVYGDFMDLAIGQINGQPRVRLYCQPGIPHVIQAGTNLADWLPVFTNTPSGSFFDFIDNEAQRFGQRFYRAVRQGN
jgi:hypothetical protein